jgi:YD repeat-containing protein
MTKIVGTGAVADLPVESTFMGDPQFSGSSDERGFLRTDTYRGGQSAMVTPSLWGDANTVPAYAMGVSAWPDSNTPLRMSESITRQFDLNLGLLSQTGQVKSLGGGQLSSLRRVQGNVFESERIATPRDDFGRIPSKTTSKGGSTVEERNSYGDGNPYPVTTVGFTSDPSVTAPSFSGQSGTQYSYGWGTHHWVSAETDTLLNRVVEYDRNLRGQVVSRHEVSSNLLVTTQYDGLGRVTEMNRHGNGMTGTTGLVTRYAYDSNDRWKTESLVVSGKSDLVTTTRFDPEGRVTEVIKPDGTHQVIRYDEWGQTCFTSGWMRPGEPEFGTSYSYNEKGRLINARDIHGNQLRGFPSEPHYSSLQFEGRAVVGTQLLSVDDRGFQSSEFRDLTGQRVAIVDGAGHLTTFAYDGFGNMVEATNGSEVRSYVYSPLGWLMGKNEPEDGTTRYSQFTALGYPRLTQRLGRSGGCTTQLAVTLDQKHRASLKQASSAGVIDVEARISYSEVFNVVQEVQQLQQANAAQTIHETYGYDGWGRETSKEISDGLARFTMR